MCKPGTRYQDIGAKVEEIAKAHGFQSNKTYCGHGINQCVSARARGAARGNPCLALEPFCGLTPLPHLCRLFHCMPNIPVRSSPLLSVTLCLLTRLSSTALRRQPRDGHDEARPGPSCSPSLTEPLTDPSILLQTFTIEPMICVGQQKEVHWPDNVRLPLLACSRLPLQTLTSSFLSPAVDRRNHRRQGIRSI